MKAELEADVTVPFNDIELDIDDELGVSEEEADELEVDVATRVELEDDETLLTTFGTEAAFAFSPEPLPPGPKTTRLALEPLGTVTTQKLAPPAPIVPLVLHSLTLCTAGSMAHGNPLQPPPGHSILTPQFGIFSRKGVAGSR